MQNDAKELKCYSIKPYGYDLATIYYCNLVTLVCPLRMTGNFKMVRVANL